MEFKSFIIRDLFDIHPTKAYKLTNKQLFSKDGIVPVVTNTSENHGRSGYSSLVATEHDIITFSDTGTKSPDSFFFQEGEFIGYPHVQGMYPFSELWSKHSLIYLTSLLRKKTRGLYDYSTKMTREIILSLQVELPVKEDGAIDFEFMNKYIYDLECERNQHLNNILVEEQLDNVVYSAKEKKAADEFMNKKVHFQKIKVEKLFVVKNNPQLNKGSFSFSSNSKYPYFTRTVFNNGILGYVDYFDDEHMIKGNSIAVGMIGMKFFYMKEDFYAGQFTKTLFPKFDQFDENIALYFIAILNKFSPIYLGCLVRDFEKLLYETEIDVPMNGDKIDFDFIRDFISYQKRRVVSNVVGGV